MYTPHTLNPIVPPMAIWANSVATVVPRGKRGANP